MHAAVLWLFCPIVCPAPDRLYWHGLLEPPAGGLPNPRAPTQVRRHRARKLGCCSRDTTSPRARVFSRCPRCQARQARSLAHGNAGIPRCCYSDQYDSIRYLEDQVLEEMRHAVVLLGLIAASGVDPDAHSRGLAVGALRGGVKDNKHTPSRGQYFAGQAREQVEKTEPHRHI